MQKEFSLMQKIDLAVDFLQDSITLTPTMGIVLGSGLSEIVSEIDVLRVIPYEVIPYFPVSTVKSHAGKLLIGQYKGREVLILQGRFHFYEGYSMQELTFPIRVLAKLGIEVLLLTNIAGGLKVDYELADLVVLEDHINLMPENPLRGLNDEIYGPRFPVMSDAYDRELLNKAQHIATHRNIRLHKGVYVSLSGPSLETKAEYAYLKMIGGDLVGMSTVPEAIVGRQLGLRVCAISCVSNIASDPEDIVHADLDEILKVAEKGGQKLAVILKDMIEQV